MAPVGHSNHLVGNCRLGCVFIGGPCGLCAPGRRRRTGGVLVSSKRNTKRHRTQPCAQSLKWIVCRNAMLDTSRVTHRRTGIRRPGSSEIQKIGVFCIVSTGGFPDSRDANAANGSVSTDFFNTERDEPSCQTSVPDKNITTQKEARARRGKISRVASIAVPSITSPNHFEPSFNRSPIRLRTVVFV